MGRDTAGGAMRPQAEQHPAPPERGGEAPNLLISLQFGALRALDRSVRDVVST